MAACVPALVHYTAATGIGPAWSEGHTFSVPAPLRELLLSRSAATDLARLAAETARELRERAMYTNAMPASSRLPFSYRMVPGAARRLVASIIGRLQRGRQDQWARFPGWPLDLSADFTADLAGLPRDYRLERTPVVLTHDLDSPEGLVNLVGRFLEVEETAGARSVSFIVPCSWPLDHGLLAEASRRGHEIGIHGYDHGNRTPFAPAEERRARLMAARPLIESYGIVGYRAPSLVRTRELLESLAPLYLYDASIPTSGGLFPVPNNGCASARPFRLHGLWEMPLSMPRDGSLRFLGHAPEEILAIWRRCAETIRDSGGVVVLLTHCEEGFSGNLAMLDIYRELLNELAADARYEFTTFAGLLPRLGQAAR